MIEQSWAVGLNGNPYVGPRTFERSQADRFFGREREARELLAIVSTERLTLFYAQSGAGKSSLLNTRLIPRLAEKGFEVLPIGRVGGVVDHPEVTNPFIFNLMRSLVKRDQAISHFANRLLPDFLAHPIYSEDGYSLADRADPLGQAKDELGGNLDPGDLIETSIVPRVLIIDQFEEILTTYLRAWDQRKDFFDQLSAALMTDPYLWVVLTLREDYVAGLDPYAHRTPNNLRTRYYMQSMGYQAALEAVEKPAAAFGRPFAPGVAEQLVNNLRQVYSDWDAAEGSGVDKSSELDSKLQGGSLRVHPLIRPHQRQTREDKLRAVPGEFIEPVQLQVVCYQLWEKLRNQSGNQILLADLTRLAGHQNLAQFINRALADFYEQAINKVLQLPTMDITERDLRDWFSTRLITARETRGLVQYGDGSNRTGGLPNEAIRLLEEQYLIRAENRAGGIWYELVHDRFIPPILHANRTWQATQRNPLTIWTQQWLISGRDVQRLLHGVQLADAQSYASEHPDNLSKAEAEFLAASTNRQTEEAAALHQAAIRRRNFLLTGLAVMLALIVLTIWALTSATEASRQKKIAEQGQRMALIAQSTANAYVDEVSRQKKIAEQGQRTALIAQGTAVAAVATAEANVSLAQQQLGLLESDRLLREARQRSAQGDIEGALKTFRAAKVANPKLEIDLPAEEQRARKQAAILLVQAGEALAAKGDHKGATVQFEAALALNPPQDTPVYIRIPEGKFTMGSTDAQVEALLQECRTQYKATADTNCPRSMFLIEKPQAQIQLGTYWIMRTEVTNAQYKRCVEAKVCKPPANNRYTNPQVSNWPVIGVDWYQATIYAQWVGGRLPNEAEWEKACRGLDARLYPWGNNAPTHELANFDFYEGTLTEVGSYSNGQSPYGLMDMAGNVWEWTSSLWGKDNQQPTYAYPYQATDGRENGNAPNTVYRVLRGGSFFNNRNTLRCAFRLNYYPNVKGNLIGFRVVSPDF